MKKLKASLLSLVAAGCLALPLSGWAQGDSSSPPEGCTEVDGKVACCGGVKIDQKFKDDQYCLPFSRLQSLFDDSPHGTMFRVKPSDNIDIFKGISSQASPS